MGVHLSMYSRSDYERRVSEDEAFFADPLPVRPFEAGGIRQARRTSDGGLEPIPTAEAWISITYNYSVLMKDIFPNTWQGMAAFFHGRTGAEMLPLLDAVISRYGVEPDEDYWATTIGNVGAIMSVVFDWCEQHPEGVFYASG